MSLFSRLKEVFSSKDNLEADLTELEDSLIEADFGPALAFELAECLKKSKDPRLTLENKIKEIFDGKILDLPLSFSKKPNVIMIVGVNGTGKTTSVAKLAYFYKQQGLKIEIAACDTFRPAAVEQLQEWANRIGCQITKSETPKDPASVAFEALNKTKADVLLIDTAGRLQNNSNLMSELSKIARVLKKIDPQAPEKTLITLDATVGQNSFQQVASFNEACPLFGIILNKIDGGAKGGSIVRIVKELKIPVIAVGTGEKLTDLKKFNLDKFIKEILD